MNNITQRIKNMSFYILCLFFLINLFIYPTEINYATKTGILLWYNNILPCIFSFSIIVKILSSTNLILFISKLLNKLFTRVFKLPGVSSIAIILGSISGYPMGAKTTNELYDNKLLTHDETFRTICIANCCGPMFIIGAIGNNMFHDIKLGYIILISQLLSCISIGIILGVNKKSSKNQLVNTTLSYKSHTNIINDSIINSVNTLLNICAIVTFFCIISKICELYHIDSLISNIITTYTKFKINPSYIKGTFFGILEITNGLYEISLSALPNISKILLTSFLINFGGLCVLMQTLSCSNNFKLNIKKYLSIKLLAGAISTIYAYIIYTLLLR